MGAENAVTSSDLQILVHETAESVASQRPECSAGAWGWGAGGVGPAGGLRSPPSAGGEGSGNHDRQPVMPQRLRPRPRLGERRWARGQMVRTLSACGPFWPWLVSKDTRWPVAGQNGRRTCGLAFQRGSADSPVLVDHAAQDPLPADRSVEWDDGGRVVVRWALVATLVRPVIVEVPGVLVEDCRGVAFVVDEDSVGALGPDAADEPFGVAVGSWCPRWDLDRFDALGGEHGIE